MPFIVGVQYKTDEVRALCGGLVRVNMYKDQVGDQQRHPTNLRSGLFLSRTIDNSPRPDWDDASLPDNGPAWDAGCETLAVTNPVYPAFTTICPGEECGDAAGAAQ